MAYPWAEAVRGAGCRIQRLPGMPSSNICLESLTGELDDFSFETYLSSPADPEVRRTSSYSRGGTSMTHQLPIPEQPAETPDE